MKISTATVTMFQLIFTPPVTSFHGSVAYPRVNTFTGSLSTVGKTACLTGLPRTPSSVYGVLLLTAVVHREIITGVFTLILAA